MAIATSPRLEMEAALIRKCWHDPEFQRQVVADPKATLERALGHKLPEQLRIVVHEENRNTMHLALPPAPQNLAELSDEGLERVAGGTEIMFTVMLGVTAVLTVGGTAAIATEKQGW